MGASLDMKCFRVELRERLSYIAYRATVTALQYVARPVMSGREAGEEREVERTVDCGFSGSLDRDSTCRLRDSKEDYLYRTILGFTKLFSDIYKRIRNALGKADKPVSNHGSPIRNPVSKPLT